MESPRKDKGVQGKTRESPRRHKSSVSNVKRRLLLTFISFVQNKFSLLFFYLHAFDVHYGTLCIFNNATCAN